MSDLKQHTEQFLKRGIEQLQKRQKEALIKIASNVEALNSDIKTRDDSAAMSEWKSQSELEVPMSSIVPEHFRYGILQMVNAQGKVFDKLNIPLLLPTNVNAVMMNLGDDAEKVPNLFQSIILRLLLSTRMNLVKVSIVDMDFGTSFPIVSSINNSMFKNQMVYRQDDVTQMIAGLAKEISEANRVFSGRYPDIDAYNASAGEMAQPYHFVFIDDFPNGFTPQAIDDLLRLIDNGNAARVGIKIFINYSTKNPTPRDFDIQRFKKPCSWINKGADGKISFENWPQNFPPNVIPTIDLDLPENVGDYVDFINGMKQKEVVYSLDGWIEDLKKKDLVWTGDTSYGIKVPIGYVTPTKQFDFYLANDKDSACQDYFALVAGGPGSGKTVFLHNIIVNAAMKYSPEDFVLYLVDFSPEGASFRIYRNLPHVRSLLLSNNKEYVLRMLEDIEMQTILRARWYERLSEDTNKIVDKLSTYRELAHERNLAGERYPKIPRVLLIMDELQGLLKTDEYSPTVTKIKEKLDNGIKQWRKFGINAILCTQTFAGVDFGSAKELASCRFALKLPEQDSVAVIRNKAAASLYGKGQVIMNNTNDGRMDMNVSFQSAFSEHYSDVVNYLDKLYHQRYNQRHVPFICQSGTKANVGDNQLLISHIENDNFDVNSSECSVFIGKPDLLRAEHTRIRYRRQLHSNTIIIGEDFKTLVYNVMIQLVQLMKQSDIKSKFYIVDCFNDGDIYRGALDGIKALSDGFIIGTPHNMEEFVDKLTDDLEQRKNTQTMTKERSFIVMINAQNCHCLRKQGHRPSPITEKLKAIFADGAPLGMHGIVHVLSYSSMFGSDNILESRDFSLFENVIFLKGADVEKTTFYNLKMDAPEKNGQMVVINAKADGEAYEQCKAYSDITAEEKKNSIVELMSNLFEKYRYE